MVRIENNIIIIENERATLEDKMILEESIDRLIEQGNSIVYIDLSYPQYLPSELMGFLMWKKKILLEQNKNIKISRLSANLKAIFDNALLLDFFEIDDTTIID
jgi:hypothetical protein